MTSPGSHRHGGGFIAAVTAYFVDSKLVPLVILATLLLGVFAVVATPSEEEPQIIVPMIDIMVSMPGAEPREIEKRVVGPMEKLIWEIPGVEYVYSTAQDGQALTIVRFLVGQDVERSLVKTYNKLYQHLDWIPPGCSTPILKPRSIDDVPVAVLTFFGDGFDSRSLRSIAAQVNEEVRAIPGVSETMFIGGLPRELGVRLHPERLAALGLDGPDVLQAIRRQNQAELAGPYSEANQALAVRLDSFLRCKADVERCVVKVAEDKPVFLGDVALVTDGPAEPESYVFHVPGQATGNGEARTGYHYPAVSLSVAKRAGVNATRLTEDVAAKVEALRGHVIPSGLKVEMTRDYGETAREKTDELLKHLLLATASVGLLIALFLGVRASLIVMIAVPVTLAITLATYYFLGYTLNRVTLFALIFCIGILVDDPIVDVENIVRHLHLPENRGRPFKEVIVGAVNEVRSPLVLATFTVVAAIMPMAFVGGLMGPYMRPMPVGASMAMLLSMAVAFVITPWTAHRFLKPETKAHDHADDWATRLYRRLMGRLITRPAWRWPFLALVVILLLGACSLFYFKLVYVKMLPFDNKSEFQVVVNMPEGTALEKTAQVAEEMGRHILGQQEVTDYQIYTGTAAPFGFNGLIRHYYLRKGPELADIQVNLTTRGERGASSHEIAKRVRPLLVEVARRHGGKVQVVEVPPGPPVLQTLVAEVYGPEEEGRLRVARQILEVFEATPNVVDVDWYVADPQPERRVVIERDKALQAGVSPDRVREVLNLSLRGTSAGLLHASEASEDVPITVRLPRERMASLPDLASAWVRSDSGAMLSVSRAARIEERTVPGPIYHKNLQPVVYVTGDMAGEEESPVYGMGRIDTALERIARDGQGAWQRGWKGELPTLYTAQPFTSKDYAMKWDGEWQITYEVFRDMGLAFGVVMILIYILVVGWFGSYTTPIAIMSPIPLSLIGIVPAHAILGAFFTATSMIGFIAGAGVVVRNSIILVDFIEQRLAEGHSLEDAVVDAGAIRFRPMLLTAAAVVAGSFVILFDPIFQGLAVSLMAGEVAATVFSRMVVPVMYYLDRRRTLAHGA